MDRIGSRVRGKKRQSSALIVQLGDRGPDSGEEPNRFDLPLHQLAYRSSDYWQLPYRNPVILKNASGIERPQVIQIVPVKRFELIERGSFVKNIEKKVEGIGQRSVEIEDQKTSFHTLLFILRGG